MPILKYKRSMQRFRSSRPSRRAMRLLWLSFVLMNLLVVLNLTGCAVSSQSLNEKPKVMLKESVIDASDWQSRVKSYSKKLQEQLNSAKKITDS